jgi:hypothetical protein
MRSKSDRAMTTVDAAQKTLVLVISMSSIEIRAALWMQHENGFGLATARSTI